MLPERPVEAGLHGAWDGAPRIARLSELDTQAESST